MSRALSASARANVVLTIQGLALVAVTLGLREAMVALFLVQLGYSDEEAVAFARLVSTAILAATGALFGAIYALSYLWVRAMAALEAWKNQGL